VQSVGEEDRGDAAVPVPTVGVAGGLARVLAFLGGEELKAERRGGDPDRTARTHLRRET
jgi:hypothetical protein